MSENHETCSVKAGGYFVASYVHPKTGKRIYARTYGKRALFIPYKTGSAKQPRQGGEK